jgi:hypothetical protein
MVAMTALLVLVVVNGGKLTGRTSSKLVRPGRPSRKRGQSGRGRV